MTDRLDDQWVNRDYPVLREVVRLMDANPNDVVRATQVETALADTHSEEQIQAAAVALVAGGYVTISGAMGLPCVFFQTITERARRATGVWPDREHLAADVVRVVEERAQNAPADERQRWQRIRDTFTEAGQEVTAKVIAEIVARQAGL